MLQKRLHSHWASKSHRMMQRRDAILISFLYISAGP